MVYVVIPYNSRRTELWEIYLGPLMPNLLKFILRFVI